jgi:hypothetical protein
MKAKWLARLLQPLMYDKASRPLICYRTNPTQTISDGTHKNLTYLRRWKIIDSKWWHPGIYLHHMILNDHATLHDHPYASVSLVLQGPIVEYWQDKPGNDQKWKARTLQTGDIVWRSARMAHQLRVEPNHAWTLFIPFFRLSKGWGFFCSTGYRSHEDYHATRKQALTEGKQGPFIGCGE